MAYRQLDLRTANPVGAAIQSYKDVNSIFTQAEDRKRAEADRIRRQEREDILWNRADELYAQQKEDRIRNQQIQDDQIARDTETHNLTVQQKKQTLEHNKKMNPLLVEQAKNNVTTSQNAAALSKINVKKAQRGVIDAEARRELIPVKARLDQIKNNYSDDLKTRNAKVSEYINSLSEKTLKVIAKNMSKEDFEAIRLGQQLGHIAMDKFAAGDKSGAGKFMALSLNLSQGDDINRGSIKEGYSLIHKEVSPNFQMAPDGRFLPNIHVMAKNEQTGGIEDYEAPATVGQGAGENDTLNLQYPDVAIERLDFQAKVADALETRLYGLGDKNTVANVDSRNSAISAGESRSRVLNKFPAVYDENAGFEKNFNNLSKVVAQEVKDSGGRFTPADGDALIADVMKMAQQDEVARHNAITESQALLKATRTGLNGGGMKYESAMDNIRAAEEKLASALISTSDGIAMFPKGKDDAIKLLENSIRQQMRAVYAAYPNEFRHNFDGKENKYAQQIIGEANIDTAVQIIKKAKDKGKALRDLEARSPKAYQVVVGRLGQKQVDEWTAVDTGPAINLPKKAGADNDGTTLKKEKKTKHKTKKAQVLNF